MKKLFTRHIKITALLLIALLATIYHTMSSGILDGAEEQVVYYPVQTKQSQAPYKPPSLVWGGLKIPLFYEEEDCTIDIGITPMNKEAFKYIKNEKLTLVAKGLVMELRNIKVHGENENDYEECDNLLTQPDCFFEIINSFETDFTLYFEFTTLRGTHFYTAVSVSDDVVYYNSTGTLSRMLGDVDSYCLHLNEASRISARDILFSNGGIPVTDAYVDWADRKVELYPLEELVDLEPVVKTIDTKTFDLMKRRWPVIYYHGEMQHVESMSLAVIGEDMTPLLCSDNRNKSNCFFSGLRSVKNNMTVYLLFRTDRVQTFYTVFTVSDDPLEAEIWHNEKVDDFMNKEMAKFQKKIISRINVSKPIFREKRVNMKKGASHGYKKGKVDSLKIRRSTFDFQFIHEKGKNTLIKMDTTDSRYRWMYDQYKEGDLIDIYHIPGYKSIRRVLNDDHVFVPERMIGQTHLLARESYELNCLEEYTDFNGDPIVLQWRNMTGVLDDYNYAFEQFSAAENSEISLTVNGELLDIVRFDMIVVPQKGKAVKFITTSMLEPEVEVCLAGLEPESSIYFDKIILRADDGTLLLFPITFVFHIGL